MTQIRRCSRLFLFLWIGFTIRFNSQFVFSTLSQVELCFDSWFGSLSLSSPLTESQCFQCPSMPSLFPLEPEFFACSSLVIKRSPQESKPHPEHEAPKLDADLKSHCESRPAAAALAWRQSKRQHRRKTVQMNECAM